MLVKQCRKPAVFSWYHPPDARTPSATSAVGQGHNAAPCTKPHCAVVAASWGDGQGLPTMKHGKMVI